jgi:hypothetical protein
MKSALFLVVTVVVTASVAVTGAGANGSPYSPGLAYGYPGVAAGSSGVHYVAFGMPKSTIVAAVHARSGNVLRSRVVNGFFGVPLVAYDGTSAGLSGDGGSLVLSSYGPRPGLRGETTFVVLGTRSLRPRARIVLRGSWSFDAVSPNASTVYLVQHLSVGDNPLYRVRPLDVATGKVGRPLVDRLEGEWDMGGLPVARAADAGGRWAFTLYARRGHEPFIHALNTADGATYCIDLPLELGYNRQHELRLRLDDRSLVVTSRRAAVATVDTTSWKVTPGGAR